MSPLTTLRQQPAHTFLTILCSSGVSESGVEILAHRLSDAMQLPTRILAVPRAGHSEVDARGVERAELSAHLAELERDGARYAPLFVLGLPYDTQHAQRIVDIAAQRGDRALLLWERVGFDFSASYAGLLRLAQLKKIAFLARIYRSDARALFPGADILTIGACIPTPFFTTAKRPRRGSPFALFVGRPTESKGIRALAELWSDNVFPKTGLPLRAYLLDDERSVIDTSRPTAGVSYHRVFDVMARADLYRDATLTIFPAIHDHLPQALIEACASGALVLATDIVGHSLVRDRVNGLRMSATLAGITGIVERVLSDERAHEKLRRNASRSAWQEHSGIAAVRSIEAAFGMLH